MAAASAAAALALISCDPVWVDVQDLRELKTAFLSVNDENSTWEAGETRYFTVTWAPEDAVIAAITLEQNIEGLVEIRPGELPNKFRVMARKAGRVKLTATVRDQNGIKATDDLTFNITGDYKPSMEVMVAKDGNGGEERRMPSRMVTDTERAWWLAFASDNESVTFNVTSGDPEILEVRKDGDKWQLDAIAPGETTLTVEMTDMFGDNQVREYTVAVFGHCTLQALMNVSWGTLGLSAVDYNYEPTDMLIEFDGIVYGWPDGHTDMRVELPMTGLRDVQTLERGFNEMELLNICEDFTAVYDWGYHSGYTYKERGFILNFNLTLDNPYIIIDDVLNPDLSPWSSVVSYNVRTNFEQPGVASQEEEL